MPLNTILMFACGLLLGLLLRKNKDGQARHGNEAEGRTMNSPFVMTGMQTTIMNTSSTLGRSPMSDDDEFSPQLANLQIALGKTRTPGRAYSAARAAGILR